MMKKKAIEYSDIVEFIKKNKPEIIFDFKFMHDLEKECSNYVKINVCDECEFFRGFEDSLGVRTYYCEKTGFEIPWDEQFCLDRQEG